MKRFEVLAVNDEKDFCECCGKKGLKRVVWIRDTETDEVKHFGTSCAVAPVKGFGVDQEVKAAIGRFNDREKMLNILAHQEYKKAGGKHGPMNDKCVFPRLDPELYNRVRTEIEARGFNY